MVKIAILGAESPLAGELIRILINHPEADIVSLYSPTLTGRSVSSIHHGLIGEFPLNFTEKINPEETDLIIFSESYDNGKKLMETLGKNEDLKFITFSRKLFPESEFSPFEIGLSEINRKALVRGATMAYLPSPAVVSSLIALTPLAQYLLLNSDIQIQFKAPKEIIDRLCKEEDINEIKHQLKIRQNSFNSKIRLDFSTEEKSERGATTLIELKNSLPLEEIEKIYDSIYDDHNFSFHTRKKAETAEVEGTQKAVFSFEKPQEDTLLIRIVTDAIMRGGAGDAVHVMNLFFGLHEKTGLNLKPSVF